MYSRSSAAYCHDNYYDNYIYLLPLYTYLQYTHQIYEEQGTACIFMNMYQYTYCNFILIAIIRSIIVVIVIGGPGLLSL